MKKTIILLSILFGITIYAIPEKKMQSAEVYTAVELASLQKNLAIVRQVKSDVGKIESNTDFTMFERLTYLRTSKLTFGNFVEYLNILHVKNRDIIVRKAIIESGWFESYLTTEYNNIFGMCTPRLRQTTSTGVAFEKTVSYDSTGTRPACSIRYSYAKFDHWTDSVDDLLMWQNYWEDRGFDTSNYYEFLHDLGYAYESGYVQTLKSINILKYYPDYC